MWESEHICLHTRLSLHTQNRPLEDKSIGWSIEHINGGSGIKSGIWAQEAEAGELWVKGKPILHRKILAYKNKWSLRKKKLKQNEEGGESQMEVWVRESWVTGKRGKKKLGRWFSKLCNHLLGKSGTLSLRAWAAHACHLSTGRKKK